jgi:predicted metal-binding membrane protein
MIREIKYTNTASENVAPLPSKFIAVCTIAFCISVAATVYFCRSMGSEMEMPGGWSMSMMWMKMPGETWLQSGFGFMLMWLAMMIAMMLPSALPTFLKTNRPWKSLCYMAGGYFIVWLAVGIGIYILAIPFMNIAMQSEWVSRMVPLLSGVLLIAIGIIQFTTWKRMQLQCCRSPFGCTVLFPQHKNSFQLGCKQGVACCVCSAAPMMIQLILGIMNMFVMIIVAIIIAAEKLLPWPAVTTRAVGMVSIIAGCFTIVTAFGLLK